MFFFPDYYLPSVPQSNTSPSLPCSSAPRRFEASSHSIGSQFYNWDPSRKSLIARNCFYWLCNFQCHCNRLWKKSPACHVYHPLHTITCHRRRNRVIKNMCRNLNRHSSRWITSITCQREYSGDSLKKKKKKTISSHLKTMTIYKKKISYLLRFPKKKNPSKRNKRFLNHFNFKLSSNSFILQSRDI